MRSDQIGRSLVQYEMRPKTGGFTDAWKLARCAFFAPFAVNGQKLLDFSYILPEYLLEPGDTVLHSRQ